LDASISCAQPTTDNIVVDDSNHSGILPSTQINLDTAHFQSTQHEILTYQTLSQMPNYRSQSRIEFVDTQDELQNSTTPPIQSRPCNRDDESDQEENIRKKTKFS
jgi:hypothetical protein